MMQLPGVGEGLPPQERLAALYATFAQLVTEIAALFRRPHVMELENMAAPFLLYEQKKFYAYQVLINAAKDGIKIVPTKIKISGLPFVKRDRCKWLRDVGQKCVALMIGAKPEQIVPFLENQMALLANNQVPLADLAVSCSLKDKNAYKKDSDNLVQLQLAAKIQKRTGVRPPAGSRLTFVLLKGAGPVNGRGELVDYARDHNLQVDLEHYLNQLQQIMLLIFLHHRDVVNVEQLCRACSANIQRYYMRTSKSSIVNWFPAIVPIALPPDVPAVEIIDDDEDSIDFENDDEDE